MEKPCTRIMSQIHQRELEAGRLCGCPACLKEAGLEVVEVFDFRLNSWKSMLVNWFSKTI
jgi:hypothetical protein